MRIQKSDLSFDVSFHDFLVKEALPGTGVDAKRFFSEFSKIVHDLASKNRALLATRDAFQQKLDDWYRKNDAPTDLAAYEAFLREIGYLLPEGPDFSVSTDK
ncbi:malate synthase, partial [Neorhizobium sp. R1-B]